MLLRLAIAETQIILLLWLLTVLIVVKGCEEDVVGMQHCLYLTSSAAGQPWPACAGAAKRTLGVYNRILLLVLQMP